MTQLILPWAIGALALAMAMAGWRLLRGPGLPDRVLALDTLYIDALALLVLLGLSLDTSVYFEAALVVAMLGFVGTVVFGRYLGSRKVIE